MLQRLSIFKIIKILRTKKANCHRSNQMAASLHRDQFSVDNMSAISSPIKKNIFSSVLIFKKQIHVNTSYGGIKLPMVA
jgi:hypothetical protein